MMIRKQWKKRLINGGILTGVFLVAVVFFSYLTNNGNDSMTADMGAATYPQISFSYDGYAFNSVPSKQKERYLTFVDDYLNFVGEYPESHYRPELDALYDKVREKI